VLRADGSIRGRYGAPGSMQGFSPCCTVTTRPQRTDDTENANWKASASLFPRAEVLSGGVELILALCSTSFSVRGMWLDMGNWNTLSVSTVGEEPPTLWAYFYGWGTTNTEGVILNLPVPCRIGSLKFSNPKLRVGIWAVPNICAQTVWWRPVYCEQPRSKIVFLLSLWHRRKQFHEMLVRW